MTQAVPEMVREALRAEGESTPVLHPRFHLSGGFTSLRFARELRALALDLGRRADLPGGTAAFAMAYRSALRAQEGYQARLFDAGDRAVDYGRRSGYPVVLVVGNIHVIHEPIMNAGIHEIVSQNGAISLPLDCFRIPGDVPPLKRVYWTYANRTLRASLAAARDGGVFPALIISYGCGPGSFLEQLFNDLMEHYPHTVLESDGHGGQAGYVTRVQAFLHAARSYRRGKADAVSAVRVARYDAFPFHRPAELKKARISVMTVGPALGKHITACLRARGYDARFSGLTDAESFRRGRLSCTGKECLPYQLIWGSFRRHLEREPPDGNRKTLLLNVTGFGPCRNGMFTLGNEMALDGMGLGDRAELVTYGNFRHDPGVFGGLWYSVVATDLLNQMRLHYRPVERNRGESDRLFQVYVDRIEELLGTFTGTRGLPALAARSGLFEKLMTDAARDFRAIDTDRELEERARTVYLSGDIFLRIDEWGSDELARKLNRHGLRVVLEPFAEIFEFLAEHRSLELVEIEERWLRNRVLRFWQNRLTRRLYGAASRVLPFLSADRIADVERASRELLSDRTPFSESVLTIGSSLLSWRTRGIDGVVVVGPWGCGPALVSEAQLRRRTEIPLLFVYNDGDPIDEARLSGFAWRLKRATARSRG